jgi:CRISPR type III-B/RAMP module RAMP protein Cmr6
MSYRYYLPSHASNTLNESHQNLQSHLGLLLDKYIPAIAIDKEEDRRREEKDQKLTKGSWFREIASSYQPDTGLIEASLARWRSFVSVLHGQVFHAKTNWRLIVGLGSNTALETGLTLHATYGLPFIAGSALKGLTRVYAASEDTGMYLPDGKPSLKIETDPEDIQRIFGGKIKNEEYAGSVIFFDAIVTNKFSLALDIMNPHYSNYYGKGEPPSNDQNPIPVPFLTVRKATFQFAVAPRDYSKQQHRDDSVRAKKWLKDALRDYGVGSKTSADYGYFVEFEDELLP